MSSTFFVMSQSSSMSIATFNFLKILINNEGLSGVKGPCAVERLAECWQRAGL